MSEENKFEEFDDEARRAGREGSMRRRSIANSRTKSRKRGTPSSGPTKFNGIHRRRSKRTSW